MLLQSAGYNLCKILITGCALIIHAKHLCEREQQLGITDIFSATIIVSGLVALFTLLDSVEDHDFQIRNQYRPVATA